MQFENLMSLQQMITQFFQVENKQRIIREWPYQQQQGVTGLQ
jgi:hypothetical protein